jgi:hypothetical protein
MRPDLVRNSGFKLTLGLVLYAPACPAAQTGSSGDVHVTSAFLSITTTSRTSRDLRGQKATYNASFDHFVISDVSCIMSDYTR